MKKVLLIIVLIVIILGSMTWMWPQADPANAVPQPASGSSRLSELLNDEGMEAYASAIEPRAFSFPTDHGPHPEYRNEWWYITGNLDAENGRRFGFELTIFRFSLTPQTADEEPNASESSAWTGKQVYIGHFAVTDVDNEQFHVAQRYARGSLGLAGAQTSPFRVWLEDWSIETAVSRIASDPGHDKRSSVGAASGAITTNDEFAIPWRIHAGDKNIAIDLTLVPLKPPILNGIDGLSQKSSQPGNASYYYSVSRLQTDGTLRVDGIDYAVTGLSWLDREWGSSALSKEQHGWDWFALQLSDGSDLMFYNLRRIDGSQDSHSAGTWIRADGRALPLTRDDVAVDVKEYWNSPHGGRYPMEWQIDVAPLALNLHVIPVLKAQELSTNVRYWEGAVDVKGQRAGNELTGRGYVELTGYAGSGSTTSQ
jgi:predicted secreted hydrolase